MDFSLSEDQLALAEAVARFCTAEFGGHATRGLGKTAAPVEAMAQLGLFGLALAPEWGGSGLGATETMLAAEQFGRVLGGEATARWLANAVLVGPLLQEHAHETQRAAWLPSLGKGEPWALAVEEPGARHPLQQIEATARAAPDAAGRPGWHLEGRKVNVIAGASARHLLVLARTSGTAADRDGVVLFAVPSDAPGVEVRRHGTLDRHGAAQVVLREAVVPPTHAVSCNGNAHAAAAGALGRGIAALCAEAAGAADALLAQCAEHLNTRRQFGAPLARQQALQHALADMAIAAEEMKSMACFAALALDDADAASRDRRLSAAKALVSQRARRVALSAIQLHGAMGMTDECRVGHFAKRLIAIGLTFGDAAHHLQRVAAPLPPPRTGPNVQPTWQLGRRPGF